MTTVTATDPVPLADDELAELTAEVRAYVENDAERWAERIEAERAVPDELWPELRDRGYLRITGRVKDVINRGGEKVPVAEIEQLLYEHPAVAEVAIVAMADDRLGERACAFVVLVDGESGLEFEEMQAYLNGRRVAKPYWPERLELVSELPRTPSGKIQKFVLREQARRFTDVHRKAIAQ